jgi:cell envelope opacity-associated protein A
MIPKITLIYLEEEQVYFSRDNRRLYVFQKYEDYCDEEIFIPVVVRKPLKDEERSPFKTKGLGKYIEVQQYQNKQGKRVAKRIAQWTPVKISKSSKK